MRAALLALAACGRIDFDGTGTCVTQISAGQFHTCALHGDGTIACWGTNAHGQLGNGTFVDTAMPVRVLASPVGPPFIGATQISCGVENSTCALRSDHTAWCWGWNVHGQLGDGTVIDQSTPVQVMAGPGAPLTGIAEIIMGEQSACARKTDRTLWCWGSNSNGQLGDGTMNDSLVPVEVVDGTGSPFVADGGLVSVAHACAWPEGGTLSCWGWNANGQLGDGTAIDHPTPVSTGVGPVTSAAAADIATCASVANTTAYCWGYNNDGELGDGTANSRPNPAAVQDPGGGDFSGVVEVGSTDRGDCARRSDGSAWCWGANNAGQLGTGSLAPMSTMLAVQVQLSGPASALAIGNVHGCALLPGDVVECWGLNTSGQLGRGTFTPSEPMPMPVQLTCP
jgi:alpha-tubulin suppressor-like RCC1 family protein